MVAGMGIRRLVSLVAFAGGGAYLGYTFGFGSGSTGLSEWVNAMISLALSIVIVVGLALIALLIRAKSYNGDPALRSVLRGGAFFLAGFGSGWALSRIAAAL